MADYQQRLSTRMRELRAEFMAAHRAGMAALARRDFVEFHSAIDRELDLMAEQKAIVDVFRLPPPDAAE